MRGRSNISFIITVIIFVVLLVVVLGRNKSREKVYEEQQAELSEMVYPDLNENMIDSMTISSLYNGVIEFRKIDGYWMVASGGQHSLMSDVSASAGEDGDVDTDSGESGEEVIPGEIKNEPRYYRGDETRIVDGLIENIKNLSRGEKVSADPEKQEGTFQVGKNLGVEVMAKDSSQNVLVNFFVGKEADQYGATNYMRYDDSGDTYEVTTAWKNLVGGPLTGWRDKSLFFFNSISITSLEIIGGDEGDLSFLRSAEGGWASDVEWKIDGAKVDGVTDAMSILKASDFARGVPNSEITGLDNPEWRVVASGDEGTFELLIGSVGDAGLYHCSTNEDDSIFMISEADINDIFVGRDKLELTAAPEPEALMENQ